MPKIEIIRRGARRSVMMDARVAHKLVQQRGWDYADGQETKGKAKTKTAKPERKTEGTHATRGGEATGTGANIHPLSPEARQARPMTAENFKVKATPTAKIIASSLSRAQLSEHTKAELKQLGESIGVDLPSSETKEQWLDRLQRYMRRDMRAVK